MLVQAEYDPKADAVTSDDPAAIAAVRECHALKNI
jgi:hypothetical protein